ncbi:MAG: phosphatase PAP2 family protein [Gammaproteobacteria bacterium]|nr:phosphatase PAP2 family protein [Gammaproteobacteria bacterium]
MKQSRLLVNAAMVSIALLLCSCGTLPNGRGWGQDATIKPGWQRIRESAVHAAKSPYTWAPLAGALLLQIDDWDKNISEWAVDKTPLFGSQRSAENASDTLRSLSVAASIITTLATPSGDSSSDWLAAKSKGIAVAAAANLLDGGVTSTLKNWTDRTRPDGSDDRSFPSGHSSVSAVNATLAARNLQSIEMGTNYRRAMGIGFGLFAGGAAWARVEANLHYPSDVLVGAALGHFLGAFVNDAFLGLNRTDNQSIDLSLAPELVLIQIHLVF